MRIFTSRAGTPDNSRAGRERFCKPKLHLA
jgi:hypothetical protein